MENIGALVYATQAHMLHARAMAIVYCVHYRPWHGALMLELTGTLAAGFTERTRIGFTVPSLAHACSTEQHWRAHPLPIKAAAR